MLIPKNFIPSRNDLQCFTVNFLYLSSSNGLLSKTLFLLFLPMRKVGRSDFTGDGQLCTLLGVVLSLNLSMS